MWSYLDSTHGAGAGAVLPDVGNFLNGMAAGIGDGSVVVDGVHVVVIDVVVDCLFPLALGIVP